MNAVATTEHYRSTLDTQALPGAGNGWLAERRKAAWQAFETRGFPTTRMEDWKYTRVRAVESTLFASPEAPQITTDELGSLSIPNLDAYQLVFVNGQFDPDLSDTLPGNAVITSLASSLDCELAEVSQVLKDHLGAVADSDTNGFVALNMAFVADGAYIHIPRGERIDKPVLLHFVSKPGETPFMAHVRNLIHVEANAEVTVIERYSALGDQADASGYLNNVVTEAVLGENAGLQHYLIEDEGAKASHVQWLEAKQAAHSRFASHAVTFKGLLNRTDIHAHLNGEGADVQMNGLYRLEGRQHADFHTRIAHNVPHCTSNEFYKGVLDGRSRGVFNGKVYVAPQAQKTDSVQKNDNLLLSSHAEADTKPELEIYADDVKCAHGATVGQLADQSVFYFQSRGIDENTARTLLVFAFANEVLHRMPLEPVRIHLEERLIAMMPDTDTAKLKELVE
ncbi:MAG: Fe-S cluster assembly protein SufD [Gammaproteobacteria bacterium]